MATKTKTHDITGYSFDITVGGTIKIPLEELNAIVTDSLKHGSYDGCEECLYAIEMWLDSEVEVASTLYDAWATSVDKLQEIESY